LFTISLTSAYTLSKGELLDGDDEASHAHLEPSYPRIQSRRFVLLKVLNSGKVSSLINSWAQKT